MHEHLTGPVLGVVVVALAGAECGTNAGRSGRILADANLQWSSGKAVQIAVRSENDVYRLMDATPWPPVS